MAISRLEMQRYVRRHVLEALGRIEELSKGLEKDAEVIQQISGFAHLQQIGDFEEAEVAVLFIDVRGSSQRARRQDVDAWGISVFLNG